MANNGKGIGPNRLCAPKSVAKYGSMAKQTTKDSKSGKQLKTNNNFSDYNVDDLIITDPIKKHYDGYSEHNRTFKGKTGTNTTASGETLFPGYSSKVVGTYKKYGKTFNKVRPGAEAKSFGEYENMAKKQKSRKINKGIDPIKASNIRSGTSRLPGTFKQYLTTEGRDRLPNMASNTFGTKSNYKRQSRLDNYLEKKLFSK